MVEDRPQRVVGVVGPGGDLDGLRDRDPEAPARMRRLRAAGLGQLRRAAVDGRVPGLDHRPPVRLLVVGDADHEDLALEAEQPAGERQRASPLPGAGLGDELADPRLAVEIGLRHRRVRLVRAGRRDALVLVVDVRRRVERLLEPSRPEQRRRSPQRVDLADLLGDLDPRLGRDLLLDQRHREDRREVGRAGRLHRRRAQRRQRLAGQVRGQVDPVGRDPLLVEDVLGRVAHSLSCPGSAGLSRRAACRGRSRRCFRRHCRPPRPR